jgi:hypothetical protein
MNHAEYTELLALEAIDALDESEATVLHTHLATCEECPRELAEWRDAAALLALYAEPVAPPAALRARLLENLRAAPHPSSAQNDPDANSGNEFNSGTGNVLPLRRSPDTGEQKLFVSKSVLWSGALAAALVILALTIALVVLWKRDHQLGAELARARETKELLTTPDVRITQLAGTSVAPRARAKLALDKRAGRAALFAYDLPPTPAGKAYQLWFIAGGTPIPGKVFATDPTGRAEIDEEIPAGARNATLFAVTLEPEQGTKAPTGDKYLLGSAS